MQLLGGSKKGPEKVFTSLARIIQGHAVVFPVQ